MNEDHPAMKELLTPDVPEGALPATTKIAHLHFDGCLWQDNSLWCLSRIGQTALAWLTSSTQSIRALSFVLVSFIELFQVI